MARIPVFLNVYDMYWINDYTSPIGLGVYHSGIQVYGREYAYGGHPYTFTGVFDMDPRDVDELGEGFRYKETVQLGYTDFGPGDIDEIIDQLGKKFNGAAYHLVKNNCNHFSADFSKVLCGKDIPNWVNRLAAIGARFPFLCACIPKEWLAPEPAVIPDYDDMDWVNIERPLMDDESVDNNVKVKES